jgi:lipoprotein-releasing system permease protein
VVSYLGLDIGKATVNHLFSTAPAVKPYWTYQVNQAGVLPYDPELGYGVLLAKNFRNNGILLGDKGQLSYMASSAGSMQEQHIPIYVAGFYDPGIIPLGGKLIMADQETTSLIRSSLSSVDQSMVNGIQVWFDQIEQAEKIKQELSQAFAARGIASYWELESYKDYESSKDLLNQLRSDKNLFTLIAVIIIIVACSNIISMLILLVNDKKREVGILQSMGASSRSIALIFGLCGVAMGILSSVIGTTAAYFTLLNLQGLVDFISSLQGYDAFNTVFYGDSLPNQMSSGALTMVWMATTFISLLAGLVPAIKASLLKPTAILRSE